MNKTLTAWIIAARPKTLAASVSPVMVATAMAIGDGIHHLPTAILCFLAALCIQIATNIANDYYDFLHGADTSERIGPTRVTQAGLIKPAYIKWAFITLFLIAALISVPLIERGGWPIATIAIASILSGLFYTAGSRPLGYMGLGDLFVLIFFGPVAVGGTYYVQSLEINLAVILVGFSVGLLSVAILCVNNLRDMESDQKTGKHTLAVRFGKSFAQFEYTTCLITAFLIPVLIYSLIDDHKSVLINVIMLFVAIPLIASIFKREGAGLNQLLAQTGLLLFVYSLLFSITWVL